MTNTKSEEFVFYFPLEKFVVRRNGYWDIASPVKKAGLIAHLVDIGWAPIQAKQWAESPDLHTVVHGADICRGKPSIFWDAVAGRRIINLAVESEIVPAPAPFPTIRRAIRHLVKGDDAGERFLLHVLGRKAQDPDWLPKHAIVFSTAQGGGKGFVTRSFMEGIGPKNCAQISLSELESDFNGRFARCEVVLADEVTTGENVRDISQKLKILIDTYETSMNRKYENQVSIRNRTLWFFASNSGVLPVKAEEGDRRYSYFVNFDKPDPEYTAALNACFEADRTTMTPAYKTEIAGFMHYLLNLEVDKEITARPYKNEARDILIEAGRPSYEVFCSEVEERGFDAVMSDYKYELEVAIREGRDWDFGENGVAFHMLHRIYKAYCRDTGQHALGGPKFGMALKNRQPVWEQARPLIKGTDRRVKCYVVPRKPRA